MGRGSLWPTYGVWLDAAARWCAAARAHSPRLEPAEACYQQALALAEELGMRPLAAHCHFGLGTLYQRVGRDAEARAELTAAAEPYRAMDMPFWLEKAEGALTQRGG
jgi:tetratricopeptide (TPR) repeat protein